jgi:hypothetical protein
MKPVAVTATADPRRSLNDGILVQASVLARVLGVRLLTLDTTVVLVPADIQVSSPVGHDGSGSAWRRGQTARTTARPARAAPTRPGARRHGLADAVRSINEGAEALATTRGDGAT